MPGPSGTCVPEVDAFVGVRDGVGVREGVSVEGSDPPGWVALGVRDGVNVIVGRVVRVAVRVRLIMPKGGVADFVPGFKTMIGSVAVFAGVPDKAEDVSSEAELVEEEPDEELFDP